MIITKQEPNKIENKILLFFEEMDRVPVFAHTVEIAAYINKSYTYTSIILNVMIAKGLIKKEKSADKKAIWIPV